MSVRYYDFSVDHFSITNTRSRHEDTDFISASVAVAGRPTVSAKQSLGDLNNGTYGTTAVLRGVPVGDGEIASFTYAIVNSGHASPASVEAALESTTTTLAAKGAEAAVTAGVTAAGAAIGASIGTGIVPIIGTALGAVAGWIVSETGALLFANCDGPVAAGVHLLPAAELAAQTGGGGRIAQTDDAPGTDSASGCGSNSHYSVAWSVGVHNFALSGPVAVKYQSLGGQAGLLGPQVVDESTCPDGVGQYAHFANDGSIYYSPKSGAFSVHGLIRAKWAALGWERCAFLAYPITDETGCPDGVGRFNHFQNGSIYWTQKTGAFSVNGAIRAKWAALGWERSSLGYPVSDEEDLAGTPGGRVSNFQHGRICWTAQKGAYLG